jgi:hypothetical protein
MAQAFGPDSDLSVNGQEIGPYVKTIEQNLTRAVLDVTTKGATGVVKRGGLTDGEISITGLWDDAATTGSFTVLSAQMVAATLSAAPIAFVYKPNGTDTYTGTCVVSQYNESSPVDDMVAFTATLSISGAVVIS